MRLIRKQLSDAKLFLIIGEDMLGVPWLGWKELKRLCTIVAARRSGSKRRRAEAGIEWLAMPQVDISSSDIRRRAAAGRSLRYLVPGAVERYLRYHHLYRKGA